ncbi:MAG: 16S rRNA (adenine(1518)-N(6)/adenine(1519)-N(6))-dimethyltransferase RsmA [Solirubrobacteraceae bacterium]
MSPSRTQRTRRGTRRERQLGQNFLVDQNIVDVIERLATVEADDVVLEIGAGPGVLSVRLAARASHLHTVEIDPRLEHELREALTRVRNVTVHIADALDLDLGALVPTPTKVVANLPYAIAATVILRTIEELPHVSRWVVMVQREVGERLAAVPRTRAYGATSVLAQLACDVEVLRRVSRTVFRPIPNVDSVLLGLRRREAAAPLQVRHLVRAGFAHRRKPLSASLALAPDQPAEIRELTRAALKEMGHPPDERAERLKPEEFRALAARLQRR